MNLRRLWEAPVQIAHPGRFSPGIVRAVRRYLDPLVRVCHRPSLRGTEHLPARGPFLLVANHSAGMGLSEILSFTALYLAQVGPDRPLAGFALPLDFHVYPLSAIVRGIGAIPSTYAAAKDTLAAGIPILVFPGGDHEALRPIWRAHRVELGGRTGFLRIARSARVPIVPMGIRGSHFTAPVLLRSRILATLLVLPRLIGVKRWGVTLLGLMVAGAIAAFAPLSWPLRGGLVWLWLGSPLVFLPWIPWTIRMRIGHPLPAADLFGSEGGEASPEELLQALSRVEGAIQACVDARGGSPGRDPAG